VGLLRDGGLASQNLFSLPKILIALLQRIHKRLIDLNAPTEIVKQIIVNIEAGVEVEVTIAA
jgi:hypothetical protein